MKKFGLLLSGILTFGIVSAQDVDNDYGAGYEAEAETDTAGSTISQPVRTPVEYPWEQVDVGDFSDPVPYAPIRQADVMYYYTVWRIIDLREKVNHPLYFPTEVRGSWRSLAQTIFDAIDLEHLDRTEGVLPVYSDDMCTMPYARDELQGILTSTTQVADIDLETGEEIGMKDVVTNFEARDIVSYNIKEVWFFDKQTSTFKVQIMEIEPILEYERQNTSNYEENEDEEGVAATMTKKRVGCIYYDELRPYLARQEVFNVKNNAQRLSFDDMLTWKRNFSSQIFKEANVYDREIQDYIANSRDQALESEKITEKLRSFESELWEM